MISVQVHAVTGHYRKPGKVDVMQIAQSYPICSPSTMAGFVESMCGEQRGVFRASSSELAYGWVKRPSGHGLLVRREQAIANQPQGSLIKSLGSTEGWRPVKRECWFDMEYRLTVRGVFEDKMWLAMLGQVVRTGVLSLGDSDDAVNWIAATDVATEWLVPGQSFSLPLRVPTSWSDLQSVQQQFTMTKPASEVPESAWMSPGGKP